MSGQTLYIRLKTIDFQCVEVLHVILCQVHKKQKRRGHYELGNIVGGPAFCYVNKSISKQVRRLPPHKFNTSFSDFLNAVDVCPVPFNLKIEGVNVQLFLDCVVYYLL